MSEQSSSFRNGKRHGNHNQFLPKTIKLDFPKYDGKEDLMSWVCRAEQYFKINGIPTLDCVSLALFHLERDA